MGGKVSTIVFHTTILLSLLVAGCADAPTVAPAFPSMPAPTVPMENPTLPAVKADQSGFTVDDKPFRFIGANSIYFGYYNEYKFSIEDAIRSAKENGIDVLRIYLGNGVGTWNGKPAEEYDRALDIASRNGMYVIAVLTDCCCMGVDPNETEDAYYQRLPYCRLTGAENLSSLKEYISKTLTRVNTVNGKVYRDDTTIMAWDIANEPYLQGYTPAELKAWLTDVSGYIKSVDPNHLVTFGMDAGSDLYNSDGPHYDALNVPGLDFFSFHHNQPDVTTAMQRLDGLQFRIEKFLSMGKPVVLEEFGVGSQRILPLTVDQTTLSAWLDAYRYQFDAAFSAGASGAMFWGWGVPETSKITLWWWDEDHDAGEEEFCELIRNYQIPKPGSFDMSDLPVQTPDDDFTDKALDLTKWQFTGYGGAGYKQDGRAILTVDDAEASSSASLSSTWSLTGNFDIQIDFEFGEGLAAPVQDHLDGAAFGVTIEGQNYHITRLRSVDEDVMVAWSSNETLSGKENIQATSGEMRMTRKDDLLTYYYGVEGGWKELARGSVPKTDARVYFMIGSVNASTAFTTSFDHFRINSGHSTYWSIAALPSSDSAPLPGTEVIPISQMQNAHPWLPLDDSQVPIVYYFYFNLQKRPFDNVLVRQAFAAAVDREALASVAASFGIRDPKPATTFTAPETLGRELYNTIGIPYDPGRARELIEEAGFGGGKEFPPVTLLVGIGKEDPDGFQEKIAAAITEMWQTNLGVHVTIEKVDFDTYKKRITSDPPELFRAVLRPLQNDPHNFLMSFQSNHKNNFGGYSNEEYDRLIELAFKGTDPLARQEAYMKIEKVLTEEETVIIPIYHALYP